MRVSHACCYPDKFQGNFSENLLPSVTEKITYEFLLFFFLLPFGDDKNSITRTDVQLISCGKEINYFQWLGRYIISLKCDTISFFKRNNHTISFHCRRIEIYNKGNVIENVFIFVSLLMEMSFFLNYRFFTLFLFMITS